MGDAPDLSGCISFQAKYVEHHAQTRPRAHTAALEAQMDPMFAPEILG